MRRLVYLVLLFVIIAIIAVYIHDGPPYWEWADLFDREWHHEKIIMLLAAFGLFFYGIFGRR